MLGFRRMQSTSSLPSLPGPLTSLPGPLTSLPGPFWLGLVAPDRFLSLVKIELFDIQLYGHLPPITKTIKVRRTRHAGYCWRSSGELISDVLWTPSYGQAKSGRPARTYVQQLCEDTGCSPKDQPEAMNDREEWWEKVSDIRAGDTIRWWWLMQYSIVRNRTFYIQPGFNCLNFWYKTWWFLSFSIFELLSSSLLLYSQHFSLRPSLEIAYVGLKWPVK